MSHRLEVLGGFRTSAEDDVPEGTLALAMLGPGPGFWPHFQASPEFKDGSSDPLDRWSLRILGNIAEALNAEALFPFGGPPYRPFIGWALKTERCFSSPAGLLAHCEHGLMVSFRGALAFSQDITLPSPASSPCDACPDQPCLAACPVSALSGQGYDVPKCRAHLATSAGQPCSDGGCLARRACPIQAGLREDAQSAFHMAAFEGKSN